VQFIFLRGLCKENINYKDQACMVSEVGERMGMEHYWNDIDRVNLITRIQSFLQPLCPPQIPHLYWPPP